MNGKYRHVSKGPKRTAPGDEHADLKDLGERLARTRKARDKQQADPSGRSGLGIAMRLSTELVVGVLVGAAIGWAFDEWLGTTPLFLVLFFFLGVAAGVRNVVRAASELNAEAAAEQSGAKPPERSGENPPAFRAFRQSRGGA